MKIKYIATIKEWRDKTFGNTYFSANIDDIEKEKTHKIEFQYGYGGHAEHVCKEAIGLKGFTSDLPIKFITIPNCKQRDVKNFGQ
jgi:hypothetical protein